MFYLGDKVDHPQACWGWSRYSGSGQDRPVLGVQLQDLTPELLNLEREFTEKLGTRVRIERKDQGGGGRVLIEFFSADDLVAIKQVLAREREAIASAAPAPAVTEAEVAAVADAVEAAPVAPKEEESDDLYSISNFTV